MNKPITPQGPPGRNGTARLDRTGKIGLILLIVVVGFVASVFYHYAMGAYLGLGYPFSTPLFYPRAAGTDFTDNIQLSRDLNPYLGSTVSAYYPVMNMVFYFFSLPLHLGHPMAIPGNVYLRMYAFLYEFLFALAVAWFSLRYLKGGSRWENLTRAFVFTFMTYPILFAIDRGNIETLLLILLLFFIHFFQRRRFLISSVFLALAITTKLYPVFLLVLFVPKKKYREIGFTVALSVVLTMVCLMCFKGGFLANLRFVLAGNNIHAFNYDTYVGNNNLVQRGVTLFTVIKVFLIETGAIARVDMARVLSSYVVTAVAAAIIVAAYVIFIEREPWKMVGLLSLAMLLLPQQSADYKMIQLLIPLFLFVNSTEQSRADTIYALLFGLLLIPKDYYFFPGTISDAWMHDISIAVFLNPAIMLLMSSMIIVDGLGRWLKARRQRRPCPLPVEQGLASR